MISLATTQAQVAKKVLVEHFTNTVCSSCALYNPELYANLDNYPEIMHLAYHPSSPYSSCLLNQHNTPENDGRTNFYGVYGATPRIVIQGEVQSPNINFNDINLFPPFLNQTSPVSIRLNQTKYLSDSIVVEVWIKTEAFNSLNDVNLIVGLAEDTIFYNSPNGEPQHYDVFRKTLNGVNGVNATLPVVGDSIGFSYTSLVHPDWNFSHIFSYVILQNNSNSQIIQSEYLLADGINSPSIVLEEESLTIPIVYPNPTKGIFTINSNDLKFEYFEIKNLMGERILKQASENTFVDFSEYPSGVYFLTTVGVKTSFTTKVVKH